MFNFFKRQKIAVISPYYEEGKFVGFSIVHDRIPHIYYLSDYNNENSDSDTITVHIVLKINELLRDGYIFKYTD
ncbi:hypothetical protein [Succinivibrio sp.]|uniref:hypothetical protein n=1 Tax=Succinivibrio sp. TaxID=2053619 RepID=UPI0025EE4939|nr:hypothetical protein [Succinivibrio sp.]MBQ9220399.1 hypothetical protein [Succinivibrio sp.]